MPVSLSKKRIKNVHDKVLENVRLGKAANVSKAMREEGYAETSIRAMKVTKTKLWATLMEEIDDEIVIRRVAEILRDGDSRASLQAADMLLKLKDRYPANKIKHAVFDERNSIMVD